MKKYIVNIEMVFPQDIKVKAKNKVQAKKIAWDIFMKKVKTRKNFITHAFFNLYD